MDIMSPPQRKIAVIPDGNTTTKNKAFYRIGSFASSFVSASGDALGNIQLTGIPEKSDGGVGRLGPEAFDPAQRTGQRVDPVVRRVNRQADDTDLPFPVGNAHSSDDVLAVIVEQAVELGDGVPVLDDDADDRDPAIHPNPSRHFRRVPGRLIVHHAWQVGKGNSGGGKSQYFVFF
jgi:hypothetical protein